MNNILKSCVVLLIISSVCVTSLAYVNEITLEPIAKQEKQAINNAFKEIFADSTEYKEGEFKFVPDGKILSVTTALNNGELDGYIIKVAPKGYSGNINMMVGIKVDGSLASIKILSHTETPGLGANSEKPAFTDKFKGVKQFPLVVVKSGAAAENEIDAITSSTITTKAVADGVNMAHEWFEANASEGGGK